MRIHSHPHPQAYSCQCSKSMRNSRLLTKFGYRRLRYYHSELVDRRVMDMMRSMPSVIGVEEFAVLYSSVFPLEIKDTNCHEVRFVVDVRLMDPFRIECEVCQAFTTKTNVCDGFVFVGWHSMTRLWLFCSIEKTARFLCENGTSTECSTDVIGLEEKHRLNKRKPSCVQNHCWVV